MLTFPRPRDTRPAINAVAVAQHSDPMTRDAMILGIEVEAEHLRRKYENICLVLAFSGCVNVGVIIWVLVSAAKAVVSF